MKRLGFLFRRIRPRKASFVYFLFFSFICIILIATLTMGIFCYRIFDQYNEEQVLEFNNKLLGQYTESVNSLVLHTAEDILRQITNDINEEYPLYQYISEPLEGNVVDTQAVHQYLFRIAELNPMIFSVGIYYPQNELLITSDYIRYPLYRSQTPPEIVHFDRVVRQVQENMISKKNYGLVLDQLEHFNYHSSMEKTYDEMLEHIIHVVRILPAGKDTIGAGIILSISGDIFATSLEEYLGADQGNVFVFNSSGEILFHTQRDQIGTSAWEIPYIHKITDSGEKNGYFKAEAEGAAYVISYSYQEESQWYYVSAAPVSTFRAMGKDVLKTVLLVSLGSVLLSLVLAAAMTHKISTPIQNLVRSLKSPNAVRPKTKIAEFEQINSSITSLKSQIAAHEKQFSDMLPVYKMHFVTQVLSGEAIPVEEAAEKMDLMNLDFPHPCFCALVMEVRQSSTEIAVEEGVLQSVLIQEEVSHVLEQAGILYLFGQKDSQILAILNFDGGEGDLEQIGKELLASAPKYYNPYFAFGTVGTDLLNLHQSYNRAEQKMRRRFLTPEQHSYFAWKTPAEYDLPLDKTYLRGFEHALHSFDLDNCIANLDALIERLRSGNYTMNTVFSALESYTKTLDQFINSSLHENNHYSAGIFTETEDIFELRLWLIELIKNAFAEINIPSRAGKNQMVASVKELVQENIQNRQLSLEMIANELGIGYKYLSRIFKDETGIRFVDYLSNCRLSHCRDLLITTELKVEDIAEMMGYSTPQYFISRFKLMFGCTPKQYRMAQETGKNGCS